MMHGCSERRRSLLLVLAGAVSERTSSRDIAGWLLPSRQCVGGELLYSRSFSSLAELCGSGGGGGCTNRMTFSTLGVVSRCFRFMKSTSTDQIR
ncbi:unnamed protein product, partial [Ectocarpus sp. 8 AP-2014]